MTAQPQRPGAHRAPTRWPVRIAVLCAVVLVAVVAVVVLDRRDPGSSDPSGRGEAAVADLVAWVDAELPDETPVRAPADVRDSPGGGRFRPQASEEPDALLVVRGAPPTGAQVLARFADGEAGALTLVDPAPGRPSPEQLQRRQRLAAAVLANPSTGATGRAEEVLRAAAVDARLLGLLAALVAQLGTGISDFPPPPGEPADGPPARHVLIGRVGTETVRPDEAATERLVEFLQAQLPPFAPDDVEVTDEGVLVGFRYASAPDAVVEENTP